jgi:hypothetical protein
MTIFNMTKGCVFVTQRPTLKLPPPETVALFYLSKKVRRQRLFHYWNFWQAYASKLQLTRNYDARKLLILGRGVANLCFQFWQTHGSSALLVQRGE